LFCRLAAAKITAVLLHRQQFFEIF